MTRQSGRRQRFRQRDAPLDPSYPETAVAALTAIVGGNPDRRTTDTFASRTPAPEIKPPRV